MTISTTSPPANAKITQLTAASLPLAGTELLEAVQTSGGAAVSVQVTVSNIASSIVGNLSISATAISTVAGLAVLGNNSTVVSNSTTIVGSAAQVLRVNDAGTLLGFGAVNLGSSAAVSGTLPAANVAVLPLANITSVAGLSVLGNAATGSAVLAPIVGGANQMVVVNNAANAVLFQSLATTIDFGIGSTASSILYRSGTAWLAQSLSTSLDLAIGSTASSLLYRTGTAWIVQSVSTTLDKTLGATQGQLLYRNATTWTTLAAGTSGFTLQTQGASQNPLWGAASGGMTLLNTLVLNNVATAGDTTSFGATYSQYFIAFQNVVPGTNTSVLQMLIATAGINFVSSGYISQIDVFVNGTAASNSTTGMIYLSGALATTSVTNNTSAGGLCGFVTVGSMSSAIMPKTFVGQVGYGTGSPNVSRIARGMPVAYWADDNFPITGVQFSFSAGNLLTGTIRIYGVS